MYLLKKSHCGFAKIIENGILLPDNIGNRSWHPDEDNATYLYFHYVNGRIGMDKKVDERLRFQITQNVNETASKVEFPESIGTLYTVDVKRAQNELEFLAAFHVNETVKDRSALNWMRDVMHVFYTDILLLNEMVKSYDRYQAPAQRAAHTASGAKQQSSCLWELRN